VGLRLVDPAVHVAEELLHLEDEGVQGHGVEQLSIQGMPKRSVNIPKRSAQNVL
jgi:hypothetical protein